MGEVTRYRATFELGAIPDPSELREAERRAREEAPTAIRYVSFGNVRSGAGVPGRKLDIFNPDKPVVDAVFDTALPQASAVAIITEALADSVNTGSSFLGVVTQAWAQAAEDAGEAAGEVAAKPLEGFFDGLLETPWGLATLFVAGGITYVIVRT